MMNRTGLVALGVLAVSAVLMVFVVMPGKTPQAPAETPAAAVTEGPDTQVAADAPAGDKAAAQPETETQAAGAPAQDAAQSDVPAAASQEDADAATAGDGEASAAPETAEGDKQAAADPTGDWVTPAFDLLRVEPDGSTVIAGRAEPNTKVEIRAGDAVIATAEAGPSGDFAAVFDEPLKAGDYQLTLNASDGSGASKASEEVATVSVPSDASGEVLAMVSEPGEPSRLITVPEEKPAAADAQEKDTAAAEAEAEKAADAAPSGAEASASETSEAASPEAAVPAALRVAAVELEGGRIFVAGQARPGALVRIYADDRLVGQAKADAKGHFVVDGRIDLAVGRHTIRADMMAADGKRVELRVSVPFDRPEGEQVAVVAPSAETQAAGQAAGLSDSAALDRLRGEAARAFALLKGLFADGRVPSAEEIAAARSATEIALKALAEFRSDAGDGEAGRASAAAADALARLRALPNDAAGLSAGLAAVEAAAGGALAAPSAVAQGGAASAGTQAQEGGAGEPETVEQAPLEASKTSVIIRRGDTLWQISRRIYGKGVRYTTIYLANQDQITDPDRIVPGQIFGVPDEATETDADAEALHRKHMRGQ